MHTRSADRWFRRVEEGAESQSCGNGMTRRDAELQSDTQRPAERHAKAATAPSTVGISKRPGGGRRGEGAGRGGRGAWVGPYQETEVWVWPSSS